MQKQKRIDDQRSGKREELPGLILHGAVIAFGIVAFLSVSILGVFLLLQDAVKEGRPDDIPFRGFVFGAMVFAVAISGIWLWRLPTRKRRGLVREVGVAMQLQEFHRVVDLCVAAPEIVRRDHQLQLLQAIASAICGNRQAAIESLEQLWRDKPTFPLAALVLAKVLLDSNLPERALEIAKSAAPRLPRDAAVPFLEARALLRLERLDEAEQALDRVMLFEPNNGHAYALAAAIELDRNHVDRAKERIARAVELAPGEPYILVVRAEIELRVDPGGQAQSLVLQAIEVVRSNPLNLLNHEITQLEAAIGLPSSRDENASSRVTVHTPSSSEGGC